MSEQSPNLSLPYIQPSQAQKHVTHNEALQRLDLVAQLSVVEQGQPEPPALPEEGERYIPGPGATGAWAGHDGEIAAYLGGTWVFLVPRPGWCAYVEEEGRSIVHDGSDWGSIPVDLTEEVLQNLPLIGVNATADTTNRLTVASAATLLTNAGAGHQLKINKAGPLDTASVLFQTGWSGRAEMGLAGTDDFDFKVSPNGTQWTTALRIGAADGRVAFPAGGVRPTVMGQTTWHVDPVSGSDANDGLMPGAGAFLTIGRAIEAIAGLDGNGTTARIELANGTHSLATPLVIDKPLVGFSGIEMVGNAATPSLVVINGAAGDLIWLQAGRLALSGVTLQNAGSGSLLRQGPGTWMSIDSLVFGASNRFHIENDGGHLEIVGSYEIAGSAQLHLKCGTGGQVLGANFTFSLSGVPNFSLEFILAMDNSVISLWNAAVAGSATGMRYLAVRGGIINTYGKGANFLPGNAAGTVATNGQYL